MKNSLKFLVGSMMLASAVALTACGGGGGGSSDPGPSAGAGVGAYGVNGAPGYLGVGQWSGGLVGQNTASPQYQQFLYQYGGGAYTTIINFSVWSGNRGMLPAQMGFKINNRTLGGDGFMNGNGFLINNYTAGYGGYGAGYGGGAYYPGQTQCFAYPCNQPAPIAQGTPAIQIVATFIDVCRTQVTVQLRYQNVIIATGTLTGWVQQISPSYGPGYPGSYPGAGYPAGYNPALSAQCNQQQPLDQTAYDPYYDNTYYKGRR
ncbi:MAG: hypothetical protein ACXVA9_09520 [Bdellovibrionales bacterium]